MTDQEREDEADKQLDAALARLSEHVDTVVIVATRRTADGQTRIMYNSQGNYFAVIGSVKSYIIDQDSKQTFRAEREADLGDTV